MSSETVTENILMEENTPSSLTSLTKEKKKKKSTREWNVLVKIDILDDSENKEDTAQQYQRTKHYFNCPTPHAAAKKAANRKFTDIYIQDADSYGLGLIHRYDGECKELTDDEMTEHARKINARHKGIVKKRGTISIVKPVIKRKLLKKIAEEIAKANENDKHVRKPDFLLKKNMDERFLLTRRRGKASSEEEPQKPILKRSSPKKKNEDNAKTSKSPVVATSPKKKNKNPEGSESPVVTASPKKKATPRKKKAEEDVPKDEDKATQKTPTMKKAKVPAKNKNETKASPARESPAKASPDKASPDKASPAKASPAKASPAKAAAPKRKRDSDAKEITPKKVKKTQ